MNRCIYCDDNISLWGNKDALYNVYIMNNKTKKIIADISAGYMDEYMRVDYEDWVPQDIQAAFNLYDKDGNIEHIMPKED